MSSPLLDDAAQESLREEAAERLAKYREMRAEQSLGDGWPTLDSHAQLETLDTIERNIEDGKRALRDMIQLQPITARPQIPADCPECGWPDYKWHGCPAKE
jgi:hypothetical protein